MTDFYNLCEATEAYQNSSRNTRKHNEARARLDLILSVEEGYEEGEDDGAQNSCLHDENDDDCNSNDDCDGDECFDSNVDARFKEDVRIGEDQPIPMFASTVTMNGLRVTIASIIEITEFLLRKDDPYEYVLTGKLNQDLIEVSIIKKNQLWFLN